MKEIIMDTNKLIRELEDAIEMYKKKIYTEKEFRFAIYNLGMISKEEIIK